MLTYLFWHRPADGVEPAAYERALLAFHDRLRAVRVPGLVVSGSATVQGLPWMPGSGYEDSYVVGDFAALGVLNAAAVDDAHAGAHDRVARTAGFGAGAVYGLESGDPLRPSRHCAWITKPAGAGYAEFRDRLGSHIAPADVAVWRRQMVLGPAPEFRLTSDRPFAVPGELTAITSRPGVLRSE